MRRAGEAFLGKEVRFYGSAEKQVESNTLDLVTMASSFHYKTSDAIREFDRILSPNGVFSAI